MDTYEPSRLIAGRPFPAQHLIINGTVFSGGMQLMIEEKRRHHRAARRPEPEWVVGVCIQIKVLTYRSSGYFTGAASPPIALRTEATSGAGFLFVACYLVT